MMLKRNKGDLYSQVTGQVISHSDIKADQLLGLVKIGKRDIVLLVTYP